MFMCPECHSDSDCEREHLALSRGPCESCHRTSECSDCQAHHEPSAGIVLSDTITDELLERARESRLTADAERSGRKSRKDWTPVGDMEPIKVRHADLERASEHSAYQSKCPKCPDGILPIRRGGENFELQALDFCFGCGQAFWYEDIEDLKSRKS